MLPNKWDNLKNQAPLFSRPSTTTGRISLSDSTCTAGPRLASAALAGG